eukprot:7323545-Prymnesium_polylepis.1
MRHKRLARAAQLAVVREQRHLEREAHLAQRRRPQVLRVVCEAGVEAGEEFGTRIVERFKGSGQARRLADDLVAPIEAVLPRLCAKAHR